MEPRIESGRRSGVVVLDAGVVRDVAQALSGRWRPEDEPDEARRAELVAAARLRLYGDRDTRGWFLVTTPAALAAVPRRAGTDWSVDFLGNVATIEGAPAGADVEAMARLSREAGIDAESADALAWAVLYEPVIHLVARDRRVYRHSRDHDLPARLELLDVVDAVDLLALAPGEAPEVGPPSGSPLADADPWWIPGEDKSEV